MKKHSRLVERVVRPYLIFIALILAAAMIVMYFSVVTKLNYEAENAGTKIAETMARQVRHIHRTNRRTCTTSEIVNLV